MKVKGGRRALVVFSGGQDSTTCLYWAIRKFGRKNVVALTFDYGHRHRVEIRSARRIAALARIGHFILNINTFRALGNSSLTADLPISGKKGKTGLPNTFVPARNIVFAAFAAAFAYPRGIGHLVMGVCEADTAGYPDCRRSTMKALEKTLRYGMEFPFHIHTPLIRKTKVETIRMAKALGAWKALSLSHTCYNGKVPPCGRCMACRLREEAFRKAGWPDPLKEER